MATAKFNVFPNPREFVNEGSSVIFYIYPTWDKVGTATPLEKGLTIPWTLSGVDSSDIVGGKTAGVFVVPTIQGASDYGHASVKIQLIADKKTEGDEKLTLSISDGSDWVTVKDTSPDPVIAQLSDFISLDSLYIPKLVSVTALEKHLSADWTEQNGAVYGSQKDNQLSFTSGSAASYVSKAASDLVRLSTATYVSKAVFDTASQTYYDSSVSFALKGVDKTNFSINKKYVSPFNGTTTIAFSTGASTTTKADDLTYTDTWSQSSKSGTTSLSDKLSYKDGLGTSLIWNSSWTDKNNGSATDFSEKQSVTYIDASKNKISFEFSCIGSDSHTLFSANLSAGSADLYEDNSSTKISWAKTALTDLSFTPDEIYVLVNGSSSFPLNDLLEKINPYIYQSANTIAISSLAGNEKSIDAGAGNDTVTGGNGNEIISGGLGNDILSGGAGDDVLYGGLGTDKLTGGAGNDTFKISKSDFDFTSTKTVLADTITDFKYTETEKDSIVLDGFGSFATFQTAALAKKAGSTANVIYESKTGNFWYNEDGDSALVGALLFANAKGIPDTYWVAAGVI